MKKNSGLFIEAEGKCIHKKTEVNRRKALKSRNIVT
jgi:hypothetical protein